MPLRVAVLYGGRSGEHEISLRSAESIIAGLDPAKYEVQRIFITPEGRWEPRALSPEPGANPGIDVVFPILHGTFGEDGTVQGLLELADLPYVGAGVLASAVAMDKEVTKRLLVERGLPVAEYATVIRGGRRNDFNLPFPLFVKPANLGSSVGISKVKTCAELPAALELAGQYDRKILVERNWPLPAGPEAEKFKADFTYGQAPDGALLEDVASQQKSFVSVLVAIAALIGIWAA